MITHDTALQTPPVAIAPAPATDRAVPGPDQPAQPAPPADPAATPQRFDLDEQPEPPNRRGRRHIDSLIRRDIRSRSRQARRREVDQLAARGAGTDVRTHARL